jgi:hypothetical protein
MTNCVKFLTNMREVLAGTVTFLEGHDIENIPTMSG